MAEKNPSEDAMRIFVDALKKSISQYSNQGRFRDYMKKNLGENLEQCRTVLNNNKRQSLLETIVAQRMPLKTIIWEHITKEGEVTISEEGVERLWKNYQSKGANRGLLMAFVLFLRNNIQDALDLRNNLWREKDVGSTKNEIGWVMYFLDALIENTKRYGTNRDLLFEYMKKSLAVRWKEVFGSNLTKQYISFQRTLAIGLVAKSKKKGEFEISEKNLKEEYTNALSKSKLGDNENLRRLMFNFFEFFKQKKAEFPELSKKLLQ